MTRYYLLLGTVAASVATMVAVVIVTDPTPGLHMSAPVTEDPYTNDEDLGAPVESYESESMEYKITYPGTWNFDDSKTTLNGHILTDPSEHVVIIITETENEKLLTVEGTKAIADSLQESLKYDSAFTLQSFQEFSWRGHHTLFTEGERLIGNDMYHVSEYNIVRSDHTSMLNVSITTKKNLEELYEKPIQQILDSLEVCHDMLL
ncbi:MAG: hypothetical protein KC680_04615 [Candidatus Peregrinibacteria bacterium]|nr:hypothetical protein [Candidatus Peregrinibacteria bacterium]MCB9807659.1 hypothetical protein [Candidatus Peribacteria bacterium]